MRQWSFFFRQGMTVEKQGWEASPQNARQELTSLSNKMKTLELKEPSVCGEARKLASRAAATMAEAVILTILKSKKLSPAEQKARMTECHDKILEHTASFGEDVLSLIHPVVREASTSYLLHGSK